MCAYTRYRRLNIWRIKLGNVFGNATPSHLMFSKTGVIFLSWFEGARPGIDVPILLGNIDSLSTLLWTQAIRCSTYSGAGIFVGRLKFSESCHRYSNLLLLIASIGASGKKAYSSVAFISGHDCGEQNSVIEP